MGGPILKGKDKREVNKKYKKQNSKWYGEQTQTIYIALKSTMFPGEIRPGTCIKCASRAKSGLQPKSSVVRSVNIRKFICNLSVSILPAGLNKLCTPATVGATSNWAQFFLQLQLHFYLSAIFSQWDVGSALITQLVISSSCGACEGNTNNKWQIIH